MTQVDWIHFRRSVRRYKKKNLDKALLKDLQEQINRVENIFDNASYKIQLIQDGGQVKQVLKGLASKYTYVKAPHYLLLTCENTPDCLFNLGYVGEQLIKFLTLNNFGTCWVGAKMSGDKLAKFVKMEEEHTFTILIAFGEPMKQLSFIRDRKRKNIKEIFYGYDNLNDTDQFVAESILTAPSAVNNQPWRFYLSNGAWDYYKAMPKGILAGAYSDKIDIDVGIGFYHLVEAARSLGSNLEFEQLEFHKDDQNYLGTIRISD